MIYTSYFAKLRSLPDNIIPISICGKAPEWYKGLQYKKLAPKYDFFKKWKDSKSDNRNEEYIKSFNEQVLKDLNALDIITDLYELILKTGNSPKEKDIVLLCYEKPSDFCHRHLVSKWFNDNGIECKELDYN